MESRLFMEKALGIKMTTQPHLLQSHKEIILRPSLQEHGKAPVSKTDEHGVRVQKLLPIT
jgi:hypothetical protein